MTAQKGEVYIHVRTDGDADQDLSGDTLQLSLIDSDVDADWHDSTFVAPEDWPPHVAAADAADPAATGSAGFWWRIMTGPDSDFPVQRGSNTLYGRLVDDPETPHFSWRILVARDA